MFWDTEVNENSLQNLLDKENPDLGSIVDNEEFLQFFRLRDEKLMKLLSEPQNIRRLIEFVFVSPDSKRSKNASELFLQQSPLLNGVLSDQKLSESIIAQVGKGDLVKAGYASRIFLSALEVATETTLGIFNTSSQILPTLFVNCDQSSVTELLMCFVSKANLQGRWFIWSALVLVSDREVTDCPEVWKNAPHIKFATIVKNAGIRIEQKISLVRVIESFASSCDDQRILQKISVFLPSIFAVNELQEYALRLALALPMNNEVVNLSKRIMAQSQSSAQIQVLALNIITKFDATNCNDIFKALAAKFIEEKTNTNVLVAYLEFFTAACANEEIMSNAVRIFANYILKNASKSNWRSSIPQIGFLLQIAEIIDQKVNIPEWVNFRSNELALWKQKGKDVLKDPKDNAEVSLVQKMAVVEDGIKTEKAPNIQASSVNEVKSGDNKKEPLVHNQQKVLDDFPKIATVQPAQVNESQPFVEEKKNHDNRPVQQQIIEEMKVGTQEKVTPIPEKKTLDVTVENFFKLINDPYWAYNGPTPEQIFCVKESFESAEEAFEFLVKQH